MIIRSGKAITGVATADSFIEVVNIWDNSIELIFHKEHEDNYNVQLSFLEMRQLIGIADEIMNPKSDTK